jgi:hypothetical protein
VGQKKPLTAEIAKKTAENAKDTENAGNVKGERPFSAASAAFLCDVCG